MNEKAYIEALEVIGVFTIGLGIMSILYGLTLHMNMSHSSVYAIGAVAGAIIHFIGVVVFK